MELVLTLQPFHVSSVAQCIGSSAQSADASCLCNSEAFINTVAQCFGSSCDATNAAAGTALGQQVRLSMRTRKEAHLGVASC